MLKNILSRECHNNFHSLNIAMIILLSPDLQHLVKYAQQLLHYFVKTYDNIYGSNYISHNIHGLLHIVDDYNIFGPLDNCSCFPFENFMKELKSMVRKHEKPLQQVVHRFMEKKNVYKIPLNQPHTKPILMNQHRDGPLLESLDEPQYSKIIFDLFTINTKQIRDSYILTYCGKVVQCLNIAYYLGEAVIICQEFLKKLPAYDSPINSEKLNIYLLSDLSNDKTIVKICQIKKKMMLIDFNGKLFALPILHSDL